jgi:hypothetical protein
MRGSFSSSFSFSTASAFRENEKEDEYELGGFVVTSGGGRQTSLALDTRPLAL